MPVPSVDAEPHSTGPGHVFLRFLLAAVFTGVTALLFVLFWLIGQAQYLEDYCHTRVPQPKASPPEALSGRPAYWDDPITVACEFDGFQTVYVTEPGPLGGALALAGMVVAVAFITCRWARPSARQDESGSS